MPALLSRNTETLPGSAASPGRSQYRRLLRRVGPGDIVVLDELDLDRITADALVEAGVLAVVNASPSISGRYPNLGPEVIVANGITPDRFGRTRSSRRSRTAPRSGSTREASTPANGSFVEGDEQSEAEISDRMIEAKNGLADHLEAFSGNTIEFIRTESPLLIDGSRRPRHRPRPEANGTS